MTVPNGTDPDDGVSRRAVLAATGTATGLGGVSLRATPAARATQDDPVVGTETVATGFTAPLGFEVPPDGGDLRYVVDQAGQIHVVGPDGVRDEPLLDLTDRMVSVGGYSERGLLGLALHPEFATNGRLFVRYSAPPREGTPSGYSHTFVLSEFAAGGDRTTADPDSERTVLEIPEPQSNHNAGAVAFGPDGLLYVAVGDGGAANDAGTGHVEDWYDANPGGNGQDVTENLLGSILRIDVDSGASSTPREEGGGAADSEDGDRPYDIPEDNPLVGRDGRDELYAWGFRNPWRMSFADGTLYAADVGQNRFEEVDVVERGGNYGWNVEEGTGCFGTDECPDRTPDDVRGGEPLLDPIIEYPHSGDGPTGIAVIGGYLYRGETVEALDGRYVFADWQANGRLFAADPADDGLWPVREVGIRPRDDRAPGSFVLGFGRDAAGELYVCTTDRRGVGGSTGAVHKLVPESGSSTGGVGDGNGGANETGGSGDRETAAGTSSTATTIPRDGQPGFGAFAALGGLGGALAARLLSRRGGRDDDGAT